MSSEPVSNRYIFVTGGARSGKTSFAIEKAEEIPGTRLYLATAPSDPADLEMCSRIERHKAERACSWQTIEEPVELAQIYVQVESPAELVLKGIHVD